MTAKRNSDIELTYRYTAAQQTVLVNPLSWLLHFLKVDIRQLRPWTHRFEYGWRSLGDEIVIFSLPIAWSSNSEFASRMDFAHPPGKRTIEKLQWELRRGMSALLRKDHSNIWRIPNLSPAVALIRLKNGKIRRYYRSKVLRDRFVTAVIDLLVSQGFTISTCPVCQEIFQIIKRQQYCSPRCSQNFRTQKYRAKRKDASQIWAKN